MKRLSILRGAGNREKVKFAPVAEQGIRSMFKPCRGNLTRVQVSPGAFSQCVGIWKTRLTQNQLLKSVQVQILSLRFYIFVHMAELADAHDLGSCAERRESSSLSMDIMLCIQ